MKDQQEAEKRKVASQEIQEQLDVQTKDVKEKKDLVLIDLAKVAVLDAQQGMWMGGCGSWEWSLQSVVKCILKCIKWN